MANNSVYTTTLWQLPPQALPPTDLKDGVFMTVWLFLTLALGWALGDLVWKKKTWAEFNTITVGTLVLFIWYAFAAVDRWLHFAQRPVVLGYILAAPVLEFLRVGSGILLLWGTYKVVWKELETRFSREHREYWWFGAKVVIFVVGLVSFYYVVLFLALSIVWMEFLSLNTIADVASKRNGFEKSTYAFFFAFGLLTVAASTATFFWKSAKTEGWVDSSRRVLWLATVILCLRSGAELGLDVRGFVVPPKRDLLLVTDITYGALTFLFLCLILYLAWRVGEFDRGGEDARAIRADVRSYILAKLRAETNEGRSKSPEWLAFLARIEAEIDNILANGQASAASTLTEREKRETAADYIHFIRERFPNLDSKVGEEDETASRPRSILSSMFSRKRPDASRSSSAPIPRASDPGIGSSAGRQPTRFASEGNMQANFNAQATGPVRSGAASFVSTGGSSTLAPPPGIARNMSISTATPSTVYGGRGPSRRHQPPTGGGGSWGGRGGPPPMAPHQETAEDDAYYA